MNSEIFKQKVLDILNKGFSKEVSNAMFAAICSTMYITGKTDASVGIKTAEALVSSLDS